MSIQPNIGDCFYGGHIGVMGRIAKVYNSELIGYKVIDVEYPGTDMEVEVYRVDKLIFHEGDKKLDSCFIVPIDYAGE